MSEFVNTSGQGVNAQLPEELKSYNWGAFLLNWIWGLGNKTYITLTIFATLLVSWIPFVGPLVPLGLSIWFGMKGNEWAWQNKQWESIEQFKDVQKKWTIAGVIVFVAGTVFSILLSVLIFGAAALSTK